MTAVKQDMHWPLSYDRIVGSSLELTKVKYFLKFSANQVIDLIGSQAQVLQRIIKTSQKIEAPRLGLAINLYINED